MSEIYRIYRENCNKNSDIVQHLRTLYTFASQCKTVTELGVRQAISTSAFAAARPEKLTCVDIVQYAEFTKLIELCKQESINIIPIIADSRYVELEPVDLLFIDTLHTYTQLTIELAKHHSKVNKYIILHDTVTYGFTDDPLNYSTNTELIADNPDGHTGLIPVIFNFLQENRDWKHLKTYNNNNGLTILTKIKHF